MRASPAPHAFALALALACCVAPTSAIPHVLLDRYVLIEGFPTGLLTEHTVVLATASGITGAAVMAIAVVSRRTPRFTVISSLGIWVMVLVVAVVTWLVTYITFRDLVHDNIEVIIGTIGMMLDNLREDLEIGYSSTDLMARLIYEGDRYYNSTLPYTSWMTYGLMQSVGKTSRMHTGLYYGLNNGQVSGTIYQSNGLINHVFGVRRPDQVPEGFTCFPKWDYGTNCSAAECGLDPARDVDSCARTCSALNPSAWVPTARNCIPPPGKPFEMAHMSVFSTAELSPDLGFNYTDPTTNISLGSYDPRARPWFKQARREFSWTTPYLFANGLRSGITLTKGIVAPNGENVGVLGLDYTLDSLRRVLAPLPPTENAVLFMLTNRWVMLSSSMDDNETQYDTGILTSPILLNISLVVREGSLLKEAAFTAVHKVGGGSLVATIAAGPAIVHSEQAVILSYPLVIVGGLNLLCLAYIPHSDVMSKADDESTRALVIAVGSSVGFCLFAFVLVNLALMPLRNLGEQMDLVAWLQLDNVKANQYTFTSDVESMQASFAQMVSSLVEFRPYLPRSMLLDSADESATSSAPESEVVTIVYTDIQSSTSIWEKSPMAMRAAVREHNTLIRQCIAETGGREIRTIGDSFMVAFDSGVAALRFSLRVQINLHDGTWPVELDTLPECARTTDTMWCGLRVRIGLHTGNTEVERLDAAGHFVDYHGTTVTIAQRMEAICPAGAVAASAKALEEMGDLATAEDPMVMGLGKVQLYGLSEAVDVKVLLPRELEGRGPEVEAQVPVRLLQMKRRCDLVEVSTSKRSSHDSTSDMSWHSEENAGRSRRDKFHEKLQRTGSASIAHVHVRFPDGLLTYELSEAVALIGEHFSSVITSAGKLAGSVLSVSGGSIVVGWNVTTTVLAHGEAACHFASNVHASLTRTFAAEGFVGIASGPLLTGNVGRSTQRFVTAFGPSLKLSRLLAESAQSLGVPCLFALPPNTPEPKGFSSAAGVLRPVDTWEICDDLEVRPILVLEVNIDEADSPDLRFDAPGSTPEWGWSPAYTAAFHAGDYEEIKTRCSKASSTLVYVASMLESGRHLRPPLNALSLE